MKIEILENGTPTLDGMTIMEFDAVHRDPVQWEEYLAQTCIQSYVIGLKIGTMWAKTLGMKVSEFASWDAWVGQKNSLERDGRALSNEETQSFSAVSFGEAAGRAKPIDAFEVQGVKL